jgi:hypothetical protein
MDPNELTSPGPTTVDLMTRGYFPDRIIPSVNSLSIEPAIPSIIAFATPRADNALARKQPGIKRSRLISHSVPKRKHLRRTLAIPHPLIQTVLSKEVADAWHFLKLGSFVSPISLSLPKLGKTRAIEPLYSLNEQVEVRAKRSVGARYLVRADIARYYPSIYTHSIAWALHGKDKARADVGKNSLVGNRLDLWTRESQDKQTGGIPIGPDTSFLIGEIIGSEMDLQLDKKLPGISGIRSMDDYYLYCSTLSEAERCIATLHEVAKEFELDINDSKTEIIPLPDALEPKWKSDLRTLSIRDDPTPQFYDLLTLFDRAFEYSKEFPSDSVLTYAAKQTLGANIKGDNWELCESLLLRATLAEPTLLPVLAEVYAQFSEYSTDEEPLTKLLTSLCAYHAPLRQEYEVAWALWLANKKRITIPKPIADIVTRLDDDIVALMSLDLRGQGLFDPSDCSVWEGHINSSALYEEHWLLAYEAAEQGWLHSQFDYIGDDEFFNILRNHDVRFFSGSATPILSAFFPY